MKKSPRTLFLIIKSKTAPMGRCFTIYCNYVISHVMSFNSKVISLPHLVWYHLIPKWYYFFVYLSRRLKCTIVITRCPSSVVINFSYFRLLLWNHWSEFNETWYEARSQPPLPSLCFSGRSENKMAALAETFSTSSLKLLNGIQRNLTGSKISMTSTKFVFFGPIGKKMAALVSDWLRHFRLLLWNRWTEFNETWHEARSCPLPSLCFSGRSEKQDCRPRLWLAETFLTSPLKPLYGIQGNLTGSKISMSSIKFVFFRSIGKTRWPPWPLIGWDIFDFSSETTEQNSKKLDRKQDLNVLYQVCDFWAFGKTRWPPWPLIGWNIFDFFSETAERNSTKLDRKQNLNVIYHVLIFGQIGKTRWPPHFWLAETFWTSHLKPL